MRHALRRCTTLLALTRAQEPPGGPRRTACAAATRRAEFCGSGRGRHGPRRRGYPRTLHAGARQTRATPSARRALRALACSPTRASPLTAATPRGPASTTRTRALPEGEYRARYERLATRRPLRQVVRRRAEHGRQARQRPSEVRDVAPPWDRNFSTVFRRGGDADDSRPHPARRGTSGSGAPRTSPRTGSPGAHYWNASIGCTASRTRGATIPRRARTPRCLPGAHARARRRGLPRAAPAGRRRPGSRAAARPTARRRARRPRRGSRPPRGPRARHVKALSVFLRQRPRERHARRRRRSAGGSGACRGRRPRAGAARLRRAPGRAGPPALVVGRAHSQELATGVALWDSRSGPSTASRSPTRQTPPTP